jgi:hypothetical protein
MPALVPFLLWSLHVELFLDRSCRHPLVTERHPVDLSGDPLLCLISLPGNTSSTTIDECDHTVCQHVRAQSWLSPLPQRSRGRCSPLYLPCVRFHASVSSLRLHWVQQDPVKPVTSNKTGLVYLTLGVFGINGLCALGAVAYRSYQKRGLDQTHRPQDRDGR